MNVSRELAVPAVSGAPRTFRQSLLAMLGLSTVVMMVAIDQTVVGTALPTIVAELDGFDLYAWVATAYLLTSVITVPIFGRLGDRLGRKPLVVTAIVLFTLASVLCGVAGSMTQLVVFRALQGIGGGMLVGTCFASIPDLFPDPVVRLRWQVMFSSAFGVANALGPSLGGFLSQHYGWRSAFLVNLPVGLASLLLVSRYLPRIVPPRGAALRPDWRGALLIAISLGASQMLVESLSDGASLWRIALLAAVAAGAVVLLLREEARAADPVLPLPLLRGRAIGTLLGLSALLGVAMFALLFYVPLLLQGGLGMSASAAGVSITPFVTFITVGTIANTRIVTRLKRPNVMLYAGFALLGAACAGLYATGDRHGAGFIVSMLAAGLGIGFVMPNLTVFAQQVAGKTHLGIATAMIQSARMVGGMLGTAIAGSVVRALYRADAAPLLDAASPGAREAWGAALLDPQSLLDPAQGAAIVAHAHAAGVAAGPLMLAARHALAASVEHAFIVIAGLMVVACVVVARLPLIELVARGEKGAGNGRAGQGG
ncbi:arabinose efflux permease family protein [Burkholderia sp. Ch1-1]|nr:arabinose efflux permease family protein [Burkholderia sp. Ch1-1]